jgi:hypothetical protein
VNKSVKNKSGKNRCFFLEEENIEVFDIKNEVSGRLFVDALDQIGEVSTSNFLRCFLS